MAELLRVQLHENLCWRTERDLVPLDAAYTAFEIEVELLAQKSGEVGL